MAFESELETLGLIVNTSNSGADGYQDLAVAAAVVQLDQDKVDAAVFVGITVDGATVRFTRNGLDPVGGSTGGVVFNRGAIFLSQSEARLAKFIRDATTSLVLHAEYYIPKPNN